MAERGTVAFQLTADLIKRRNDMRLILGDEYAENAAQFRAVLRGVAAEDGLELAEAALEIARRMDADGCDPSMVFAALVDECEANPPNGGKGQG